MPKWRAAPLATCVGSQIRKRALLDHRFGIPAKPVQQRMWRPILIRHRRMASKICVLPMVVCQNGDDTVAQKAIHVPRVSIGQVLSIWVIPGDHRKQHALGARITFHGSSMGLICHALHPSPNLALDDLVPSPVARDDNYQANAYSTDHSVRRGRVSCIAERNRRRFYRLTRLPCVRVGWLAGDIEPATLPLAILA